MIAIIDGDVLCYHACKPRWEEKSYMKTGVGVVNLDDNGDRIYDTFTPEQDAEYLEQSWEHLKRDLDILVDTVFADTYLMSVKGPDNFRNMMYPEYKLNRHADPTKRNKFVPVLRELAVAEGLAVPSEGREADDYLHIWANEARKAGEEYTICSIDKDLLCIPGKHFLMRDKKLITMSEKESMLHYYAQLLSGDPTDNIPGLPRIGKVKAEKALMDCTTEEECQEVTIGMYIAAYQDEWRNMLLSNGKMIHIQGHLGDYFNFSNWPLAKEIG